MSLVVIWLNWIYNVIWYPTIMALIAGTFVYFFNPGLASSKIYMCVSRSCSLLGSDLDQFPRDEGFESVELAWGHSRERFYRWRSLPFSAFFGFFKASPCKSNSPGISSFPKECKIAI